MEIDQRLREALGLRIKGLRTAQKMTVQELASASGISAGYLSELERGLSAVSSLKLMQIANALGVAASDLLETVEDPGQAVEAVSIPAALSQAAEQLNISHRATLLLLEGKQSLMARRAQSREREWTVQDWLNFYEKVKDYLPPC